MNRLLDIGKKVAADEEVSVCSDLQYVTPDFILLYGKAIIDEVTALIEPTEKSLSFEVEAHYYKLIEQINKHFTEPTG